MTQIIVQNTDTTNPVHLTDLSPRDAKWDSHRANAATIGKHYDKNERYAKLGNRIAGCSTFLNFAELINQETGEIGLKLRTAFFCKVRHCSVCSWRRSLRNTARFFAAIPKLQAQFPKHRWLFLTLTVRNCEPESLRETIKLMNAAFKRLIERKNWPAEGYIKAVEVTRGADGSAHPHFHILLMVKPSYFAGHSYVKHEEWSARWQDAMRIDYTPIVDVRVVKAKKEGQTIEAAIVETLKYATKVQDLLQHADWLYTITEQLHKLRFVETGGALKGLLKEDFSNDELIAGDEPVESSDDEKPEEKLVGVSWNAKTKRYVRTKTAA